MKSTYRIPLTFILKLQYAHFNWFWVKCEVKDREKVQIATALKTTLLKFYLEPNVFNQHYIHNTKFTPRPWLACVCKSFLLTFTAIN